MLAALAGAFVVMANLGIWLQSDPVGPRQSGEIAARTYDGVSADLIAQLSRSAFTILADRQQPTTADPSAPPQASVTPRLAADVDEAARNAVAGSTSLKAWNDAVRQALNQVEGVLDGNPPPDAPIVLTVETRTLADATGSALARQGYPISDRQVASPPYQVTINAYQGSGIDNLRTFAGLGWLLALVAVALCAASIAVAPHRWRMAIVLCIDVLVMLAGCLLLIPALRAAAEAKVENDDQTFVMAGAYDVVVESLRTQTLTWMAITAFVLAIAVVGNQMRKGARARESAGGARRRVEST